MQINVTFDSSVSQAPAGFIPAVDYVVNYFDSLFTTNVTLNIDVLYQNLSSGNLAENQASQFVSNNYSSVMSALQAQGAPGSSALPPSSPLPGRSLYMTQAEAQALGLYPNDGSLDGHVWLSSTAPFSYSPTATPASNQFYFVGIVEHEISELMGRVSFLSYSPIDLYRYSSPGARDLSTGGKGSTAYFSIDNGTTNLGTWNNQSSNGDLADWYPQGPTAGGNDAFNDYSNSGVLNVLSSSDITLMEALGWTTTQPSQVPVVTSVIGTPSTGDLNAGKTVKITLNLNETVSVAGGAPTLTLNDGGTATYTGGSGTNALVFIYTVQPGDNAADLKVTGLNLPSGVTIQDAASHNLSGDVTADLHLKIDTLDPSEQNLVANVDNHTTNVTTGHMITLILTSSEPVTVTGAPTLQLNDNEMATYRSGSGSNTLTFSYTVQSGDHVADLQVTALNLPSGAAIQDLAGNVFSGNVTGDLALQINTVTSALIQAANLGILRVADTAADASAVAASINSGQLTFTNYVNQLIGQAQSTTVPAVAVEATMYGVTGTSVEITNLTNNFLPAQVQNAVSHGLNPQVYACEVVGLAFA